MQRDTICHFGGKGDGTCMLVSQVWGITLYLYVFRKLSEHRDINICLVNVNIWIGWFMTWISGHFWPIFHWQTRYFQITTKLLAGVSCHYALNTHWSFIFTLNNWKRRWHNCIFHYFHFIQNVRQYVKVCSPWFQIYSLYIQEAGTNINQNSLILNKLSSLYLLNWNGKIVKT